MAVDVDARRDARRDDAAHARIAGEQPLHVHHLGDAGDTLPEEKLRDLLRAELRTAAAQDLGGYEFTYLRFRESKVAAASSRCEKKANSNSNTSSKSETHSNTNSIQRQDAAATFFDPNRHVFSAFISSLADIPRPGQTLPAGGPAVTLFASGRTTDDAIAELRGRVACIETFMKATRAHANEV
jgi:hypothetical protein